MCRALSFVGFFPLPLYTIYLFVSLLVDFKVDDNLTFPPYSVITMYLLKLILTLNYRAFINKQIFSFNNISGYLMFDMEWICKLNVEVGN